MSIFTCESCGAKYKKWAGRCNNCDSWNSLVEGDGVDKVSSVFGAKTFEARDVEIVTLTQHQASPLQRITTDISEFDRVMGGGFVKGCAVLIGGEPGIGKSTLILQVAQKLAKKQLPVLYVSAEESISQVAVRATRLGVDENIITITSASSVLDVIAKIKKLPPKVLIVDSIQVVYISTIESNPGTVNQIRASTFELINFCKANNIILIIIGHITKEGQIAGPKLLEHMVDAVIYFENNTTNDLRLLRSVKNRFGNTNEIGLFTMSSSGLIEVVNPSLLFISKESNRGHIMFVALEGTRPMIVEIESLTATSYLPAPRRNVVGWDINRLAMIVAVLQRRCKFQLHDNDIYLNIAGGFKTMDPAADLAVAMSLIISRNNIVIKDNTIVLGEIALSGQIRNVSNLEMRLRESVKLGYKHFILPNTDSARKVFSDADGLNITYVDAITDLPVLSN